MLVPPTAIGSLLLALRDRDWRVREQATRTLVSLGNPAAEALGAEIEHSDEAARALLAMGPAAVPALVERTARGDLPSPAWKAAQLLVKLGEASVPAVVARLRRDRADEYAEVLVYALGEIASELGERARPIIVPVLMEMLREGSPNSRMMAAIGLEKNAAIADGAVNDLVGVLEEARQGQRPDPAGHDERLRQQVVAALVRIGPEAVARLLQSWRRYQGEAWTQTTVGVALERIAGLDRNVAASLAGSLPGARVLVAPRERVTSLPAAEPFSLASASVMPSLLMAAPPVDGALSRRRYVLLGFMAGATLMLLIFLSLLLDVWHVFFQRVE